VRDSVLDEDSEEIPKKKKAEETPKNEETTPLSSTTPMTSTEARSFFHQAQAAMARLAYKKDHAVKR